MAWHLQASPICVDRYPPQASANAEANLDILLNSLTFLIRTRFTFISLTDHGAPIKNEWCAKQVHSDYIFLISLTKHITIPSIPSLIFILSSKQLLLTVIQHILEKKQL